MKVNEGHLASALHHSPRSHRRVNAPGHEDNKFTADSHRQPTGAAELLEVHQGLPGQYLHEDVDLRVLEADLRAGKLLDVSAQLAIKLRRSQVKGLVPAL